MITRAKNYLLFELSVQATIKPNGPAIKGGCVTWRRHPATCPGTLATFESRWQDRYGACFCHPGTSLILCVSGDGTNSHGTTFDSRYRS